MKRVNRFSWRGLTPQLFAIVILPITALLLLVSFGGLRLHQTAMRNLVGERDERAARAAASALTEQINHRLTAIQGIALQTGAITDQANLADILSSAAYLLPDFDLGLAFYTPEGQLLASSGDSSFWQDPDLMTGAGLMSSLAQNGSPTLSSISHPASGDLVMMVVSSGKNGEPITAGAFSPARMVQRVLASIFIPGEGSQAFVVDSQHRLLYRIGSFQADKNLGDHPGVDEALRGESGASYIRLDNEEHVIAYSPIPIADWALVIEEPWQMVASPELRLTESAPLVLIPAILLALIALWFGTRRIVQPLQALEAKAAELAWGNFQAIEEPVGGIAEIRRLHTELIHLAHKVRVAQEGLRGYIGAMTLGQEEERRRLARELHDDTLQALIALNQRIQLAQLALSKRSAASLAISSPRHPAIMPEPVSGEAGKMPVPGDAAGSSLVLGDLNGDELKALGGSIAEIQVLTEQTIQGLRRLTRALRPIYLEDLGLVAALDMLSREMDHSDALRVHFKVSGAERRLPAVVELALYRIAQEAMNNVVRHAQASQASLEIAFESESVRLEVTDDGQGFETPESPAEFAPGGHYGLLGMHERAELIGARLEIQSTPGKGTRLVVALPQ